jgi:hypothetical protein
LSIDTFNLGDLTTFLGTVLLLFMSPRKNETPEQSISGSLKKSSFFPQFTKTKELNVISTRPVTSQPTNTITRKVSGFFFHDILWFFIACSALIATLGFYFGFFQPLVLEKYVDNELVLLDQSQSYVQKTTQTAQKAQDIILSKTTTPNVLACSESSKYTSATQDLSNIDELKGLSKLPEQFTSTPKFLIFSDIQVESIHTNFVAKYQESLQSLETHALTISQSVYRAQYRNSWIDFCMYIEKSKGVLSELQDACTTQIASESLARKQLDTSAISQFKDIISSKDQYCTEIFTLNNGPYTKYNQLRLESIDFVDTISKQTVQTPFNTKEDLKNIEKIIADTKSQLTSVVEERKSFPGMWYIIGIDVR